MHGPAHARQGPWPRQVLQAGEGRLRAERGIVRQTPERRFEGRVVTEAVGVVGVLVAGRDHRHAEAQDVAHLVPDPLRRPRVVDAGGQALGDAEPPLDLAQGQHARIGRELPAVDAADEGLAADRRQILWG